MPSFSPAPPIGPEVDPDLISGPITNDDVAEDAAIAYSKLALANHIVSGDIVDGTILNADINNAAGITYGKLNLANSIVSADIVDGTIVNADINNAAAIAYSKLNLSNSIVTGDILDGTLTNADINPSAAIADSKLASSVMPIYRQIIRGSVTVVGGAGTAGTYTLQANGQTPSGNGNMWLIRLDSADLAVSGKTTKLRIKAIATSNGTSVGAVTFTAGLYPVTAFSGGAGALNQTTGAVVSGSTVAFASPATNLLTNSNSGDFTLPADGYYAIGYNLSSDAASNSRFGLDVALEFHHV